MFLKIIPKMISVGAIGRRKNLAMYGEAKMTKDSVKNIEISLILRSFACGFERNLLVKFKIVSVFICF